MYVQNEFSTADRKCTTKYFYILSEKDVKESLFLVFLREKFAILLKVSIILD